MRRDKRRLARAPHLLGERRHGLLWPLAMAVVFDQRGENHVWDQRRIARSIRRKKQPDQRAGPLPAAWDQTVRVVVAVDVDPKNFPVLIRFFRVADYYPT